MYRAKKAVESLEDRCRKLEHRCEDLERHNKALRLEWEETYDKVRRSMSRISKRVAVDAKEAAEPFVANEAPEPQSGLDPISEGILRRRGSFSGGPI